MNKVILNNISKMIGNEKVLDQVSVVFQGGEIYGVLGRNGSGKTMLLRAICGLLKPTDGEVYFNHLQLHKDISYPPSVGVIIENPSFWNQFSGIENLDMLASIQKKASREDIRESIKRVGLNPDDKRPLKKYSLGMKQRLAIAQGIMEKPDLIVFDEPTNALDEEAIDLLRKILIEEKARGAIIVIASHNKDDIRELSDVIYKMDKGRLQNVANSEV